VVPAGGLLRVAAAPVRSGPADGSPALFDRLRALDEQATRYRDAARLAADAIGDRLVAHPAVDGPGRVRALRLKRLLRNGSCPTFRDGVALADLAGRVLPGDDLAGRLTDLVALAGALGAARRDIDRLVAAEEARPHGDPPVGPVSVTALPIVADGGWAGGDPLPPAGAGLAAPYAHRLAALTGTALRIAALAAADAGPHPDWAPARSSGSGYADLVRFLEGRLGTGDPLDISDDLLDAVGAAAPDLDGPLDSLLRPVRGPAGPLAVLDRVAPTSDQSGVPRRGFRYSLAAWPGRDAVPRITAGGALVVAPAQWRVDRSELGEPGDRLANRLAALERLRRRRGLPRLVNVTTGVPEEPVTVDLCALPGLRALDSLAARGTEPLLVRELFAGPGGYVVELVLRLNPVEGADHVPVRAAGARRR
jgi:hypothetical protein